MSIGDRIKQFRLSRGWSLDELVAEIGGVVTKTALSKYERNLIKPSNKVLNAIAKAFDTKAIHLAIPPELNIEFVAYRKGSGLSKKDQLQVENLVATSLEDRIKVQDLLFPSGVSNLPVKEYKIDKIEDVEDAAVDLRNKWNLGLDPISNIVQNLENNFVHVITIHHQKSFDGISALGFDSNSKLKAAAVVSKRNIPGERQRLNLTHELGHIVLDIPARLDEEKVAFRFGGAFLAPKDTIHKVVGSRRDHFQVRELFILKKYFGLSVQALLFRFRDLEIITQSIFSNWYMIINRNGWKKNEPNPIKEELPQWFEKSILHAFSEGLISSDEASRLLGDEVDSKELSLIKKKEFLKLALTDRNKLLAEQADKFVEHYNNNREWKEFGGDIVEY